MIDNGNCFQLLYFNMVNYTIPLKRNYRKSIMYQKSLLIPINKLFEKFLVRVPITFAI